MTFIILAELVARMEEEKAAIHAEYEQERIAYQKLLKDYNLLETANDDLKDRVTMLRGGGKSDRAVSNLSMTSSLMTEEDVSLVTMREDESAYGGSMSDRSNVVSRQERDRNLETVTVMPEDVGLMMKLQAALKEAHREKEVLEKKVEEYESSSPRVEQSSEMLRLQELEMENVKLKEDMTRLRSAIVDSDGDNEAVREMAEQYENIQEEYDRVKVECLQLKTVLANVQLSGSLESGEPGSLVSDNADDVMMAYETQKKVIQQLQASLNQEKVRSVRAERETRAELEKLRALSSEQQTVIQTNMNKSPTNQTEAYMQHELTR